jgi:hypothetical protein
MTFRSPGTADLHGFNRHANVWAPPNDRAGPERLARYLLHPNLAQDRLRLPADGRVVVELKIPPWQDGTTELAFEPLEGLEKLAAMTRRPEVHLFISHGAARSARPVAPFRPCLWSDPGRPSGLGGCHFPAGARHQAP